MSNNTIEEIKKALATSLPGTYKLYRGTGTGAEENIKIHLLNLENIGHRIEQAKQAGCLIEVISLRLQIIDFWLRVYFVNTAPLGEKRQKEFGRLLDQCKKLGLDNSLYKRLSNFNKHRVNAIHGYVVGRTTYEELIPVVEESKKLGSDTIIFVLGNCGKTITSLFGTYDVGDMILNVPAQVANLRAMTKI